jgi:hypothetical protein
VITYNLRIPNFTAASLTSAAGGAVTNGNLSAIIFPGTNRSFILTEIDLEGFGTASATSEFAIFRTITTAAAGAATTTLTPQPTVSLATPPAFTGTAAQSGYATTQPTLAGASIHSCPLNQNGQRYFWRANPNLDNALDCPGTATALLNGLALVQIGGAGVIPMAGRIQIKEI